MKYLFFDIECANCYQNCAKIFSLGYVVTDENFNILHDKEDVLIKSNFPDILDQKIRRYEAGLETGGDEEEEEEEEPGKKK